MAISQTVYVNIVVRGGLSNATDVTGSLKNIQTEAAKTGASIEQNMNSAFKNTSVEANRASTNSVMSAKAAAKAKQDELSLAAATASLDDKYQTQTLSMLQRRQTLLNEIAQTHGRGSAAQIKEMTAIEQTLASMEMKKAQSDAKDLANRQKNQLWIDRTTADETRKAEAAAQREVVRAEKVAAAKAREVEKGVVAQQRVAQRAAREELALLQVTAHEEDKLRTQRLKTTEAARNKALKEQERASQIEAEQGSRTLATLQKALVSMVGVLAAWTLLITIPQLIFKGIVTITEAIIKFGEELAKSTLSTAGLLASFATFGDTSEKSFVGAFNASKKLQFVFAEMAAQSLASAEDMQKAFQIFVARGGLAFSGDLDKSAKTAAFLTNLVVAMTGDLQKEKQIYTEIDALMSGQARAGATIARLLKAQVGDLGEYLNLHRQQGDLLEDLQKRFAGITEASARLGQTLSGMITSLKGTATILNGMAYQNGAFPVIQTALKGWRDLLQGTVKELSNVKSVSQDLTPGTETVLRAFITLQLAVVSVVKALQGMLEVLTGARNEAEALMTIADVVLRITTSISALSAGGVMQRAASELVQYLKSVNTITPELLNNIELYIDKADKYDAVSKKLLGDTAVQIERIRALMSEPVVDNNEIRNQVATLVSSLDVIGLHDSLPEAISRAFNASMEIIPTRIQQIREAILQGLSDIELTTPLIAPKKAILTDQQTKSLDKLRMELVLLQADGFKFLEIQIKQAERARELAVTFAEVPAHLREALKINEEITKLMLLQSQRGVIEGPMRGLENSLKNINASWNEFAAAGEKYRATVEATMIEFRAYPDYMRDAVSLVNAIYVAELNSTTLRKIDAAIYTKIRDTQGEIAESLAKQSMDERAIYTLAGMTSGEKARLLELLRQQYSLERQITFEKQTRAASTELLTLYKELEKASGKYSDIRELSVEQSLREAKISEDYKGQTHLLTLMLGVIKEIYQWKRYTAELDAQARNTKEMADNTRITITNIRAAVDAYELLATTSFNASVGISELTQQVKANEKELDNLRIQSENASSEELKSLISQMHELSRATLEARSAILQLSNPFTLLQIQLARGQNALSGFVGGTVKWGTALKAVGEMFLAQFAMGIGSAVTSMFQAFAAGESVLGSFRKFLGQILIQMGELAISLGVIALTMSWIPIFSALAGHPGLAVALIAAGVAAIAAGVVLGGSGGSSKGASAGAGGGTGTNVNAGEPKTQTIYMEPYFQRQQSIYFDKLNGTIAKLDTTLNKLSTKAPGVVVMEGAPFAAKVLTKSIDKQLQTDQTARSSFSKTIFGET